MVFALIMKLCFFDPLTRVIMEREGLVQSNIEESKRLQSQVINEIKSKDPKTILNKAKESSAKIINDAINDASSSKVKLLDESRTQLETKLNENLEALTKEQDSIRANISSLVAELSLAAVNKLVSELNSRREALT